MVRSKSKIDITFSILFPYTIKTATTTPQPSDTVITMNNGTEALFTKAQELQHVGQLQQAIGYYEQLLVLLPHHLDALRFIALAYAQMNDMYNASLYLSRALELEPTDPRLHNNLGNVYKKLHADDKAIHHYQKALEFDPEYAQAHHNIATLYALQDEFQKALNHYRLAIHAQPDFLEAHYHLGLLLLKNNRLEAAYKQFNNVLALKPDHLEAQFYIGILELEANALEKAEQAFQKVLMINAEHVEALVNLGVIALKNEQGQLAIDYFTQALALDNHHIEARNNLAATFIHHDRFENALMHYDVLLQSDPNHIEYLYNTGVAQMSLGHLQEAIVLFEKIVALQEDHFAALNNLAAIHMRLGQRDQAILLLKRALIANPKDDASQFMLNALTGQKQKTEASATYVSNLFNHYALNYEQHVQGTLNYALPHAIGRVLHQLNITHAKKAIDLGCGTGLSGVVLRELSGHLTGVDLSAKMLAQAKSKGIYDALEEADLITFLKQNITERPLPTSRGLSAGSSDNQRVLDPADKPRDVGVVNRQEPLQPNRVYDLAVAADVLPYLGELSTLFKLINQHLTPSGVFIFTHEISETDPWQLQESARFSHHPDYIKALCAEQHLQILHEEKVVARQQNGQALYVILYAVARTE